MNWMDVAVNTVAGFLVSLLVADGLRLVLGLSWPRQSAGLRLELRLMPWIVTITAGPALLYDATVSHLREGALNRLDLAAATLVLLLWSASYGQCLSGLVRMLT